MNKEFEILREKLAIQKLNAQTHFSRIQQAYSIYMLLVVGASLPIYFTFGFGTFFFSILVFTMVFFLLIQNPSKKMKEARSRAFAIGNLMHRKLEINIVKLNKELDDLENKIKEGKMIEV